MCGIAGSVELEGSAAPRAQRLAELERMVALLGHRGPDDSGVFLDPRVALAATRLSISDIAHGQQPMHDGARRYWIVFNGEIYNHVELRAELTQRGHSFRTSCDTEVALRSWIEWGEQAPPRFDGGYAIAIYDRTERELILVRDRFGKRPLFYTRQGASVVFGSEIKALLARRGLRLAWDAQALASIFTKWTALDEETAFRGVRQVRPGACLRISAAGLRERTFASFPCATERADVSLDDAAAQAASLLRESVRRRLRADVEVGVLLSGGLDSTVLARLIREQRSGSVRSFSLTFADARFDESEAQQQAVDAFELTHASLQIGPDQIADAFCDALWHAEQPQFRAAFVPMFLLSRLVREHGIKVVFSGEGADEILLGYDIFKEARVRAAFHQLDGAERSARVRRLYRYLPDFSAQSARAWEAMLARTCADRDDPLFSHRLRLENGRFAARLLRGGEGALPELRERVASLPGFGALSSVRKAQWLEVHTLLQGYLLSSQGDRAMFAHGVEPRCPFLSPALAEYAATLPEHYLLAPDDDEKHLLKRAFRDALPPAILTRPKQPYRAPDASSFFAAQEGADERRLRPWVEELLSPQALGQIDVLDGAESARFLDKLRRTPQQRLSAREDQAFMLLLSLAALQRQFITGDRAQRTQLARPIGRVIELEDGRS